jgi:D-sedoheptulose 7-phosphate isomerase
MHEHAPQVNAIVEAAVGARSATSLWLRDAVTSIASAAEVVRSALDGGNKLMLFGNGGSASQAQHIATELVGRFERERGPLAAVALTESSLLTAIANDYGYDEVFARQVRGLGRAGDVAMALSTSGRSPNVLAGVAAARAVGMYVVALTGQLPNLLADAADLVIAIPSGDTQLVQEAQLAVGHIICQAVDAVGSAT